MPIKEHPPRGSIVTVDYSKGFKEPEMVKLRLAVVLSPNIKNRVNLATVVPLSLTQPDLIMPYHKTLTIPFYMGKWGTPERWIKGDMVNSVGFHRIDFIRIGKNRQGDRIYQYNTLDIENFKTVQKCALHGMGFSFLTRHL